MRDEADSVLVGRGFYFEQMPVGFRFHTVGRTITETDLVSFVNLIWFTEELFTNLHDADARLLQGRVVPAALVYGFAEGLIAPSMNLTGQAFLGMNLDVKAPTFVGDTIHVECEVIEARPASKGNRGHVRTRNDVVNHHGNVVVSYTPLRLVKRKPA